MRTVDLDQRDTSAATGSGGLLAGRTAKRFTSGTHRTVAPEETWQRIAPLLADYGITRVADLTGLDRIGLPVASAMRPLSRSVVVAAGKGVTLAAAKVSAAMEAIECAHAETIDRPLFFASRAELARERPAPPLDLLPQMSGASLDDSTRLLWIEARTLDSDLMMVPYELVHAHYCPYDLPAAGSFQATTNGLASGNTLAEAVCHGLFEVIERDALTLWSRRSAAERHQRSVHVGKGDAPLVEETLAALERNRFRAAVWDITSDAAVPAFHALIIDEADPLGHPGTGTGCHPDKGIALFRAISEAAQVRATYISGGRDDLSRREYDVAHIDAFKRQLEGMQPQPARRFADIASSANAHFEEDVAETAARLDKIGCGPVVTVDLSRPESGIFVVRVLVPGLEGPLDADARPGRRALEMAQ
jgi:ribosomal protein S12 methylthiotransferase accessory factor